MFISLFIENEEGVKMVRFAAQQMQNLCPQVINAARILAARPRSKVAQDNMFAFQSAWQVQVMILTDAVDDIISVEDFLSVSENHILEDVNKCCLALQEKDPETLDRLAAIIKGRTGRIANVVECEMDNYEPGVYTERVMEAIKLFRSQVMPNFTTKVEKAIVTLTNDSEGLSTDENEFIDASRLIYDGVREIRRAVLLNRDEDIDSDTEWEDDDDTNQTGSLCPPQVESRTDSNIDEYPDITGISNAREAMKQLPEEDKEKIAQQVEVFRVEKRAFDREVSKWDDNGNDVIVIAKHMCTIMMEMTDFTRGKGPLKTTMDVINAAKKISEAGTRLDKLARLIADQCPESSTKQDLLAYLQELVYKYCFFALCGSKPWEAIFQAKNVEVAGSALSKKIYNRI